jgi:hypothetical protein
VLIFTTFEANFAKVHDAAMDTIAHLPLTQIIDYLGARDRARAAQVCRRWRDVVAAAPWPGWRIAQLTAAYSAVCARGTVEAARRWAAQLGITRHDIFCGSGTPFVANDIVVGGPAAGGVLDSAAANPDSSVLQWLVVEHQISLGDFRRMDMRPMTVAAWCGHSATVAWLLDRLYRLESPAADIHGATTLFAALCHHANNRDLLKSLIATHGQASVGALANRSEAIRAACAGGNVLWLIETLEIPEHAVFAEDCLYLRNLCKEGRLDDLKELCERYGIHLFRARALFAQAACTGGLAAAQWLAARYEIKPADVRPAPDHIRPLGDAVLRGHIAMADWLRDTFGLTDPADLDMGRSLRHCIARRDAAAVAWLATRFNIGPIVRANMNPGVHTNLLQQAIQGGDITLVQLLVDKAAITVEDLRAHGGHLIQVAAFEAHYDLVLWLTATFGLCAVDFGEFLLYRFSVRGALALLKWAVNRFGYTAADAAKQQCVWAAIKGGYTSSAAWLAERFDVAASDIGHNMRNLLDQAMNGNEETFLWALEWFQPTDADVMHDDCVLFRAACTFGRLRAARELARRWPIPASAVAEALEDAREAGFVDVAAFLETLQ